MSSTTKRQTKVIGYTACMADNPEIAPWQPLSKGAVAALPPLPAAAPRPSLITPAASEAKKKAVRVEQAAEGDGGAPPAPEAKGAAQEAAAPAADNGFHLLKRVTPDKIAPFLVHEHPQTVALILSQLDSGHAAEILTHLDEGVQADLIYRVSTMGNVAPTALLQLEETLEKQFSALDADQDVGGPKVAADILNLTGSSIEQHVLEKMDKTDGEVAEAVRHLMFVFADIVNLSDRDLQVLLSEIDQKDLVIALKAAGEPLKEKILSNVSERVWAFITEEMELLGPMPLSEVEQVQLRIVQQARQLEADNKLTIRRVLDDQFV